MNIQKVNDFLSSFTTEERQQVFEKVIQNRTRYITLVLEDIYQPHNASAVLRTADCFGIQDIHVIENRNQYNVNPDVALGSSKWLTLNKFNQNENNTLTAIKYLRNQGYRIVATTPHTKDIDLPDFEIEAGKCALFFGTELQGLSSIVLNNADEFLKIPMYGFTESYNISVSAAIILYDLTSRLRESGIKWNLSENEIEEIKFEWLKQSIKSSDMLIKKFLEEK